MSQLDLQKIFPVQNATIAIAHHGENKIAGQPVENLLESIVSSTPSTSIAQLAEYLVQRFDKPIRNTLGAIRDAEKCAFGVCGFSRATKSPTIIEIEWKKTEVSIEFRQMEAGDLFMSGNAHDLVAEYTRNPIDGQFTWKKLWSANEKYHLRFHEKLWRTAELRQQSEDKHVFGGHKHVLVLTPKQWRWATPPMLPNQAE